MTLFRMMLISINELLNLEEYILHILIQIFHKNSYYFLILNKIFAILIEFYIKFVIKK